MEEPDQQTRIENGAPDHIHCLPTGAVAGGQQTATVADSLRGVDHYRLGTLDGAVTFGRYDAITNGHGAAAGRRLLRNPHRGYK